MSEPIELTDDQKQLKVCVDQIKVLEDRARKLKDLRKVLQDRILASISVGCVVNIEMRFKNSPKPHTWDGAYFINAYYQNDELMYRFGSSNADPESLEIKAKHVKISYCDRINQPTA